MPLTRVHAHVPIDNYAMLSQSARLRAPYVRSPLLMAMALAFIGSVRGGLAYVNLIANMMMASILGSTVAQITIMSRMAVPEMERAGQLEKWS